MLTIGRTSSIESFPMMKPQHSQGNSRSACATMRSIFDRRIFSVVMITAPCPRSRLPIWHWMRRFIGRDRARMLQRQRDIIEALEQDALRMRRYLEMRRPSGRVGNLLACEVDGEFVARLLRDRLENRIDLLGLQDDRHQAVL